MEKKSANRKVPERSSVSFPYNDLESCIEVARAVFENAGSSCTTDQAAAYLKLSSASSGFRLRLSATSVYGIIESNRSEIRLTELGHEIIESKVGDSSRVSAFLHVPLYKQLYEAFKGKTLPPSAGLEREMQKIGVTPNVTSKARQIFDRSAKQAGFFAYGSDKLIMPSMLDSTPTASKEEKKPKEEKLSNSLGLDPVIKALVEKIPSDVNWSGKDQAKWLQMMAMTFALVYDTKGSMNVIYNESDDD